ncbi:hypothetical protein BsWGS_28096 [Bradybaena similaris]
MVMLDLCEDRSSCVVLASPETFTQDPCVGTPKYLEAHYKCRPDEFEHRTVCEGETMEIVCGRGDRIAVYSAMFGRTLNGTDRCPASKQEYIDCQAAGTLSEVSSRCQGRRECALTASHSVFGDPCAAAINTYLTVSYACVPRKILKQIHHRTNKKKKRKKKKKKKEDEKGSEELDIVANVTADAEISQHHITAAPAPEWLDQQDSSHIASVTEDVKQNYLSKEVTSESSDVTTAQDDITTQEDIHTEVPDRAEETHTEQAEQNHRTTTVSLIVDSGDSLYDKDADLVVSPTWSPEINDNNPDKIAAYNLYNTYNKESDFQNTSEQINGDGTEGNFDNTPFNQISYNSGQDFESMSSSKNSVEPLQESVPNVDFTSNAPSLTTTWNPESLNITKGPGSRAELDSVRTVQSKKMNEVPESPYVTERNLTVLCVNYTKTDVRWVQFVRPRDEFTIGFLRDWFSAIHYLQVHQEKAWLYFTLGICFGIIVMLLFVLIKVCINFRRNIRARLDVSEPTHRSAHINNHSSLDAPMLEHSDSVDRIEVVRFSPRNTLRSQRSNSHHRDLVNYYG